MQVSQRVAIVWQRLRRAIQEMNYATRYVVELQAPWAASGQQVMCRMPKWICRIIGHDRDVCPFCNAVWCWHCDKHITPAKEPCATHN